MAGAADMLFGLLAGSFGPPITPFTSTITTLGAGSIAVPVNARQAVFKLSGAGGGGAVVNDFGSETGGGASGAYVIKTVAFSVFDGGRSIAYSIPTGGAGAAAGSVEAAGSTGGTATVTATLSDQSISLSAGGGQGGRTNNTASSGGTASGGDTNTNGNNGTSSTGATAPTGAVGDGGNAGFVDDAEGEDGTDGQLIIEWS